MEILMELTEKYMVVDEQAAEFLINKYKEVQDTCLVDYKVSVKDTKTDHYVIVTLKTRSLTLAEAKEKLGQ